MHSSNSSDLTAGAIHSGCSTAVNKSASTQRSETVGKNWPSSLSRKASSAGNGRRDESEQDLLHTSLGTESDVDSDTSDLPPAAKRSPNPRPMNLNDGDL